MTTAEIRTRKPHCHWRARWGVPAAIAIATILQPDLAGAAIYHVGSGGCSHATIAAALLSAIATPGPDTIYLTRTISYSNVQLTLTNWNPATIGSVALVGGIDTCGGTTPNGRTVLNGVAGNPVITVEAGAGQASVVGLTNLELTAGSRGLDVSGNSHVGLVRTSIHHNNGGVRVTTGGRVDTDEFTMVHTNVGTLFGGGISCTDPASTVNLAAIVSGNQATSAGGGLFVSNFCNVTLGDGAFLIDNSAPLGGGIYLQSGASVWGGGGSPFGVSVSDNTASNAGGGLYLNGSNTLATFTNVAIDGNSAANFGGGFAAVNGGELRISRSVTPSLCPNTPRCTSISNNTLTSGGFGTAGYVASGSYARLVHTFIESNAGPAEAGFLLYAEGAGSELVLEGAQLWNNRTVSLFQAASAAQIQAAFVSAARNSYLIAGAPPYFNSRGAQAEGNAAIGLFTSILVDQRPFTTSSGGTVAGDCLLLDTAVGLTTSTGTPLVGVDPRFRNPAVGDLRLNLDSPAIDSCDTFTTTPAYLDYDLDLRGWDYPNKPNVLGAYDRGADEVRPLFADGFESGNVAAWSTAVP